MLRPPAPPNAHPLSAYDHGVDDGGALAGGDPPRMGGDWNVNGLILRASHSPINPSSCSGPPGGRSLPCAAFSTHAPDRPEVGPCLALHSPHILADRPEVGPCLAPHSPHILADRPEAGPCLAPHSPRMLRTARRSVPALRRILRTFSRNLKLRETQTIELLACGWASPRRQGISECWMPVS
jgi:hypothetical protein